MATFSWGDLRQAADEAGFTTVPAGPYAVSVKTAEAKKTGTGKDKISVRFTINTGPMSGKSLFNDFVISPENGTALGFFFRHMKAMGLGPDYFATNPALEKVAQDLVGRSCEADVGIRLWNEEERNEIKGLKPLGTPSAAAPAGGGVPQPQPTPQPQPAPQPTPQPAPTPQPQPAPAVPKTDVKKADPVDASATEPATEAVPAAGGTTPPDMPF